MPLLCAIAPRRCGFRYHGANGAGGCLAEVVRADLLTPETVIRRPVAEVMGGHISTHEAGSKARSKSFSWL